MIYGHTKPNSSLSSSGNKQIPIYHELLDQLKSYSERNGYWKGLQNKCGDTPRYLKKVVGVSGDNISVTFSGVYINKEKIINSEPLKRILSDEIFINYEKNFKLKKDEYFLMSDYNPMSYDSRYFGVIKKSDINTVVVPFYNF